MKLDSFEKLYVHELKDLYSAESQLIEALPKMAEAASDAALGKAFEHHLEQTRGQQKRLEKIFEGLEYEPGGHKCAAMEGLIHEGEDAIGIDADDQIRDAALIAAAQRVEHYEMAGYGSACAFAEKLGRFDDADLLRETLDEEGCADRKLTTIASRSVNFKALVS
ncbi:hypothetical protein Mal64_25980 [Pseudobythopirellula maris]|uniref:Uncharacterized protein n=1 Tax=Pseudobythopirellula maris TaxID=2527991 RepID=A0A5C5ZPK3_9BACT|nr:ferritin-like domain-containing protein [Pseudobythopirellula maris]TWT89106.1 hypothetical protein Mal64_25980 [Pseudobythopirellula maris]